MRIKLSDVHYVGYRVIEARVTATATVQHEGVLGRDPVRGGEPPVSVGARRSHIALRFGSERRLLVFCLRILPLLLLRTRSRFDTIPLCAVVRETY